MGTSNFRTFWMSSQTETEEIVEVEVENDASLKIILYNDDVNTFDHVIECLVDICNHTMIQAEQVALIVHTKGKCDVKRGDLSELKPKCEALQDRGLSAQIEA